MRKSVIYITASLLMAVVLVLFLLGSHVEAADKENCLMCHKYSFMGRIDENGKRINYNVDENIYAHSVHRNVPCRDCHTYITKIPHDPVTEEVNCANQCHIKPPFSNENFSTHTGDVYSETRYWGVSYHYGGLFRIGQIEPSYVKPVTKLK